MTEQTATGVTTPTIDVMVAGAQKAGTSSLKEYLAGVPGVHTHSAREFVYFVSDEEYERGYPAAFRDAFGAVAPGDRVFAKSVGVMYRSSALARLRASSPDVRIELLLRNPVSRAYSAYWYARRMGWESIPSFEEAFDAGTDRFEGDWVRARNCAYEQRGRYAEHLRSIHEHFEPSQVRVHLFEDFIRDPRAVCEQIWAGVGLHPTELPDFGRRHNRSALPRSEVAARILATDGVLRRAAKALLPRGLGRRMRIRMRNWNQRDFVPPKMAPETRERLVEHYRPFNADLASMLERDLSQWNA